MNPRLAEKAQKLTRSCLAKSTAKCYASNLKPYVVFCETYQEPIFPLKEDVLIFFVTERSEKVKYGTITGNLGAIKKLAVLTNNHVDFRKFRILKCTLKGIRKLKGDKIQKPKTSITLDMLNHVLKLLDPNRKDDCVLMTSFLMAEYGLLRGSEFCYKKDYPGRALFLNNLEFLPNWKSCMFIRLTIRASKTDVFRKSFRVHYSRTNSKYCVVTLVFRLLRHYGIVSFQDFQLNRHRLLFTFDNGRPLTITKATFALKKLCKFLNLPGDFSLISFRKGGATTLRMLNCPDHVIQTLGRWKSDAFKRYVFITPWILARIHRAMSRVSGMAEDWSWLAYLND